MLKVALNPDMRESEPPGVAEVLRALEGPKSLNLFPTENRMSPAALQAMASDAGRRYQFSVGEDCFYGDTGTLDEVIKECERLACQYFSAKHAFVDGLSGLNTMHWVLTSFAKRGARIAIMDPSCGGHYATKQICQDLEYPTVYLPYDRDACDIDYDACASLDANIVYLDTSTLVTLPSIPKLREALGPDVLICFDASQVLALVPAHLDRIGPASGLDVLNGSTHKTLPGPQKGMALTQSSETAERLAVRLPYVVSNMHVNATGALAITMIEMMHRRERYAHAIAFNARALAASLHSRGLKIPRRNGTFTETQQVWIEAESTQIAIEWGYALRDGNIRSTVVPLPSNGRPGLRIGVQELTRTGMAEAEMDIVADIVAECLLKAKDPQRTRSRVDNLVTRFSDVTFIDEPTKRTATQ